MPQTVNGVGTAVCKAGGDVWGDSYDAMECFVIFFIPIIPYAAYHTFGWNGSQYRRVPIRATGELVARTYLRAWRWVLLLAAGVVVLLSIRGGPLASPFAAVVAVLAAALFAGITWGLRLAH